MNLFKLIKNPCFICDSFVAKVFHKLITGYRLRVSALRRGRRFSGMSGLIAAFCITAIIITLPKPLTAETVGQVCTTFSDPGAEVDECGDKGACYHPDAGGGGGGGSYASSQNALSGSVPMYGYQRAGCGTCGAPVVSLKDGVVTVEDTPFFYKVPAGPDMFLRWKYTYDLNDISANDDSILGEKIKVSNFNTYIKWATVNSGDIWKKEMTLFRGDDQLVLTGNFSSSFYQPTKYTNTYSDFLNICEARVRSYSSPEIELYFPKHNVTQIFRDDRRFCPEGESRYLFRFYTLRSVVSANGVTNNFNYGYRDNNSSRMLTNIVEVSGACRTAVFFYAYNQGYFLLTNCVLRTRNGDVIRNASFEYADGERKLVKVTDMNGFETGISWFDGKISEISNSTARTEIIYDRSGEEVTLNRYLDPTDPDSSCLIEGETYHGSSYYKTIKYSGENQPEYKTRTRYIDIKGKDFPQYVCRNYSTETTLKQITYYRYDFGNYYYCTPGKLCFQWTTNIICSGVDSYWLSGGHCVYLFDKMFVYYNDRDEDYFNNLESESTLRKDGTLSTTTYDEYYANNELYLPQKYLGALKEKTNPNGVKTFFHYETSSYNIAGIDMDCTLEGTVLNYRNDESFTSKTYLDSLNREVKEVDAEDNYIIYKYHDLPIQTGETDLDFSARFQRLKSSQTYDSSSNPIGPVAIYEYGEYPNGDGSNAGLHLEKETPPYQGTTTRYYDVLDRLVRSVSPDGSEEIQTYGCCQNVQSVSRKKAGGSFVLINDYEYDGIGRVINERFYFDHSSAPLEKKYSYNALGNVLSIVETDNNGTVLAVSSNVYNMLGDLIEQNSRSGSTYLSTNFNGKGIAQTINFPNNSSTQTVKSIFYIDGLLRSKIISDETTSRTNSFYYDLVGNMISNVNVDGAFTAYQYDAVDRLTNETFFAANGSNPETKIYEYDKNGNVIKEIDEEGNCMMMEYDALGRVTASIIDLDGDGIRNDAIDAVTKIEYQTYTIPGTPAPLSKKTPGDIIIIKPPIDGEKRLLIKTTNPEGFVTYVKYGAAGEKIAEYNSSHYKTYYIYDDMFGRLTKIFFPPHPDEYIGQTETFSYDSQNLVSKTDKLGRTTSFEYDGLNRLKKTTYPDGRTFTKTFVTDSKTITKDLIASENVTGGFDSDQFLYFYDNQNRKTNSVHDTNKNGQVDSVDRPTFSKYNGFGELIKVSGYDVYPVSYSYYNNGLLKSLTDGEDNSTGFKYDFRGRLTKKIFPDNNFYEYSYYKNSLLKSRIRNSVTTDYFYSMLGKVTNTVYSDSITPSVTFTYNKLGQRTFMKDGSGKDTFYEYYTTSEQDGANLPLLKNINRGNLFSNQTVWTPDSKISYCYFPYNLKRKSMEVFKDGTSVQKLDYEYDDDDRLTKIKKGTDEYAYSYKQNWDLVSSVTAPEKNGSAVSQCFTYDGLGRKKSVSTHNPFLGVRYYFYNAAGQRNYQTIYPPDFSSHDIISYSYDKFGQLISAKKTKDAVPQADYSFSYQYDKIGNRTDEQRNGFNFDFLHNNLNQLTQREWSGTLTALGKTSHESFPTPSTIDINSKSGTLDANGKYIVQSIDVRQGDNNLITAINKAETLTNGTKSIKWEKMDFEPKKINLKYDACGNLTNDGVRSYTYDAENRLKTIKSENKSATYKYDGLGRKVYIYELCRIGNTIAIYQFDYLYDGWNVVAELTVDNGQLTINKTYTWGLDMSGSLQGAGGVGGLLSSTEYRTQNTEHFFFCYDGNGNVINLIDIDTKEIAAHYEYDPFGRLILKEGSFADRNYYRFSTKRYSPFFGLYDYGYRHYSPDLGSWLTRDPIGESGGLNLYGFVQNNPVSYVDPLGLLKAETFGMLFGDLDDDEVSKKYLGGKKECRPMAGYFQHCVNNCSMNRINPLKFTAAGILGEILSVVSTFAAAANTGNDSPFDKSSYYSGATSKGGIGQPYNANATGIKNSYKFWTTCIESCKKSTLKKIKKTCCKIKGKLFSGKDDSDCCEKKD